MSLEVRVARDFRLRERIGVEVSVNDLTVGCAPLPVPNIHVAIERTAIASEDTEADKVGIPMEEREFHCRGEFKGVHKGRPDENDLKAAAEFAKAVAGE